MNQKFKKNFHIAKKITKKKIEKLIKNYPRNFNTPKYMLFMKAMKELGWSIKLYEARVSKYVFIYKNDQIFKIRFSNHKPLYHKEIEEDCDYYVGISHKQVKTTESLIKELSNLDK